jgi:hypothetical protein
MQLSRKSKRQAGKDVDKEVVTKRPARAAAGSASIPEASISYRYRIVLVSIARIDIESIRYRFLTAFTLHPLNSSFFTFSYHDSIKIYLQNVFLFWTRVFLHTIYFNRVY